MAEDDTRPDSRGLTGFVLGLLIAGVIGGLMWAQSRSEDGGGSPVAAPSSTTAPPPTSSTVPAPPEAACQAVARWAALANPGASDDPVERAAWAELQAQIISVENPLAMRAYDDMVQAYYDGSDAVAAAAAEQIAAAQGVYGRNTAALDAFEDEYLRRMAAGNYDPPPLPASEEFPTFDATKIAEAKDTAAIKIQSARGRFLAQCP